MALTAKSLFLYGYEITPLNRSLDFDIGGPTLLATLKLGFYSLTSLMLEIKRAMESVDLANKYTITASRTVNGGLENRVTIATNGATLNLLFGTGPRVISSIASLIGFASTDQTGGTSYVGTSSSGTALVPEYIGYSYLGPEFVRSLFGNLNISARGDKEAIIWNVQKFFQIEFKYEPGTKVISQWVNFLTWAIEQKPLDFTPEITTGYLFYECTLESTGADGKGLGYLMSEMLPEFPFNYKTGVMKFRQKT
jgi:hypothetical protein